MDVERQSIALRFFAKNPLVCLLPLPGCVNRTYPEFQHLKPFFSNTLTN